MGEPRPKGNFSQVRKARSGFQKIPDGGIGPFMFDGVLVWHDALHY